MIDDKKILAIIPARGGSKGLVRKNVKKLGGKELIGWTIEAALGCGYIDSVMVSTDCPRISAVAKRYGATVPFLRPSNLASDNSKTADAVRHVIENISQEFDILVLLQPTSPFRSSVHITEALDKFIAKEMVSVVSVCELSKSPFWSFWIDSESRIKGILNGVFSNERRQDLDKAFVLNGALYVQTIKQFLDTGEFVHTNSFAYEMDKRSSVDIDDIVDFKLAEILVDINYD